MAGFTIDKVVSAIIKLRDEKATIMAEAKARCSDLDQKMAKLEAWIKIQADSQGVTSFKTVNGTAFLTTTEYANVADWDAVLAFIKENEAYDLLERRVSKNAVRGYIDMHKAVPPGVNFGAKLEVSVRKPSNKLED